MLSMIYRGEKIQVKPNCETNPTNIDCVCFSGKTKVAKTDCPLNLEQTCDDEIRYECVKPQCSEETVQIDCKDKLHVLCVGEWTCVQQLCNWDCT